MLLPSFKTVRDQNKQSKPRLMVLEVRDKSTPKGDVLARIAVEREEVYQRDDRGHLEYAKITFSYEELKAHYRDVHSFNNQFVASYMARSNLISLSSSTHTPGFITLDLRHLLNQRIGTYFFSHIVEWAKQWPQADINPIELLIGQGVGENKLRRNRFYERFNLQFAYTSDDQRAGHSKPMLAQDLYVVDSWKENIKEVGFMDYLITLNRSKEILDAELGTTKQALKQCTQRLDHIESKPMRWALMQWARWALPNGWIVVAGMLAVFSAWRHYS